MKRALALAALLALPLLGTACGDMKDDTSTSESFLLGDALPGTNAGNFAEAKDAFNTSENAADGLGPIFNERGCGTCHQNGAIGGAGQQIERRYGTLTNGVFNGACEYGRLAAAAVRPRRLQRRRPELPVGHGRQPGAGRDDLRGPSHHAAVRPRSGRFAA